MEKIMESLGVLGRKVQVIYNPDRAVRNFTVIIDQSIPNAEELRTTRIDTDDPYYTLISELVKATGGKGVKRDETNS